MGVRYAEVIGDPIAHSKSPLIHKFWLAKLEIEADYRATFVQPGDLTGHFEHRRHDPDWAGCNVTMPHKADVLRLADRVDDAVDAIGSANTIIASEGALAAHNTDIDGIVAALGEEGLQKRPVLILGNGGAARTTLAVLKSRKLEEVAIVARDAAKSERLSARFGLRLVEPEAPQLLINASPLGMTGFDPMPETMLGLVDLMQPEGIVFDMVYSPTETQLLARARQRGLKAIGGLDMLIGQADAAFRLFFGQPAPREHDAELRGLLTS
jgi:shikimate dehydrogenase